VRLLLPRFAEKRRQTGHRSLADGESLSSGLLLGESGSILVGLSNTTGLLEAVELNVAVRAEVGRDATMSTVRPPAAGNGALDHNVVDDALLNIESLGLSVGTEVAEEVADGVHGLLGPATESVLEGLALGVSADTTSVPAVRDNLGLIERVLHVRDCLVELVPLDGLGDVVGVLVVSAEVINSALGGYDTGKREYIVKRDTIAYILWVRRAALNI